MAATVPNGFIALGLAPELIAAVEDLGFDQPTPVQLKVIPLAMASSQEGKAQFIDLMVSSQTGSGKTAAFLLPVLHTLLKQQAAAEAQERADFERAMLARRITTNWDAAGSGARGSGVAAALSDNAIAARQRYVAALEAVGPELSSMLAQVCCLSAGLEQAERLLNLPQRSGKAVLGLGLTALARHYGLLNAGRRRNDTRHWGLDGYRPAIAGAQPGEA